jgi:membrane-bound serine protease (ClpP class)
MLTKIKKLLSLLLVIFVMLSGQTNKDSIYVASITGTIDNGLPPYLERVLEEASAAGAKAIVLEINTFGGRVDAAVEIKDLLFNTDLRTIAFIDKRAISAGAFISLACDDILMVPGSLMGAATVVDGSGEKGSEKQISYFREEMAATAKEKGRNPEIARGMVDEDVEIDSLSIKGKLITLTVDDALQWQMADYKVTSLEAGLEKLGFSEVHLTRVESNWAEDIVRFLTGPIVAGLLMSLGFLGLIFELRSPGWGVGGTIGIIALLLFFGSHYIINLAEAWEILLFLLGVALLAVEIFIIPGFGIAGISGLILILTSVFLGTLGSWDFVTREDINNSLYALLAALLLTIVSAIATFRALPRWSAFRRVILEDEEKISKGYISSKRDYTPLVGKSGIARSDLRPTGIAEIAGQRYDVVSQGDFIDAGSNIKVIATENYRIIVAKQG